MSGECGDGAQRAIESDGRDQREIQIWNDAVAACKEAAMAALLELEAEAANGLPSPARSLVRAVGSCLQGGDARRQITGFDLSDFPQPEKET